MRIRRAVTLAFSALSLMPACGDSPLSPSEGRLAVQDFVSSVSSSDGEAERIEGAAPPPGDGPTIDVAGNPNVVNGGTSAITLSAASPFTTAYVVVGGASRGLATEGAGGIEGYYRVQLSSLRRSLTLLLAFPQSIPASEFELLFAVADVTGAVGPFTALTTQVTEVGTGDVQVTLSWDADSDVDLHVVDPSGEEIYYGRRQSASGGQLDLDSNAACSIDGVRNENVTWATGTAPRGTYTVRVDYWSSCGVERTNFTVRINNGGVATTAAGSFTGPGDQGGQGSGLTVATFERATGPTASAPSYAASAEPSTKSQTISKPRKP